MLSASWLTVRLPRRRPPSSAAPIEAASAAVPPSYALAVPRTAPDASTGSAGSLL